MTHSIATLKTVVLDTPEITRDAAFWAHLTGGELIEQDDDWITVGTPDGWRLAFQLAPDLVPAEWPGQEHPQQLHLDVKVPDLAAATADAVANGARLLRENEKWNTLADPSGHPFDLVRGDDVERPTLWGVAFDVPDARASSQFWSALLGVGIAYDGEEGAMLDGDRPVLFQVVENYNAPDWPDPSRPQQGHLDLDVHGGDLDAAEEAALALGATRLPGGSQTFRVYADPAGHPFCLCVS